MSRRILVVVLIVVAIVAVATSAGFGAYYLGYDHALANPAERAGEVVHHVYWAGFAGLALLARIVLSPLVLLLVVIAIVAGVARRRRWASWGPWSAPSCGNEADPRAGQPPYGPRATFDEWHRQAHATQNPPAGDAADQGGNGAA